MPLLATALGLSLLGSCGGLLVASSLLLFTDSVRTRLVPWLVSYAVGALLGVALLALLPEALTTARAAGGVRHAARRHPRCSSCSRSSCCSATATPTSARCTAPPRRCVIIGDAFHNFIDGAIICTAVLTSVPLGINTAIAVAAHEIPQEVGDVAILLAAGYSRRRALMLNIVSGASGILGALVAFAAVEVVPSIRPYVLAFSSASLLYIAMSDLIPDLHRGADRRATRCARCCSSPPGIGTIVLFERLIGWS